VASGDGGKGVVVRGSKGSHALTENVLRLTEHRHQPRIERLYVRDRIQAGTARAAGGGSSKTNSHKVRPATSASMSRKSTLLAGRRRAKVLADGGQVALKTLTRPVLTPANSLAKPFVTSINDVSAAFISQSGMCR
jgi:hypothetical protein